MKQHGVWDLESNTEFCCKVKHYAAMFRKRLNADFASECDIRIFLKSVYIDWMLDCPMRPELSVEARYPLEVAKALIVAPKTSARCGEDEIANLRTALLRAIDEVVPLFGKDVTNRWTLGLRYFSDRWGFEILVSQIVVSELLPDEAVGIVDAARWPRYWRGGRI